MQKLIENYRLKIKKVLSIIAFYFCRVFPIKKNKVVFSNFLGKGYGDNPKYIHMELEKMGDDIDCVWLVSNINEEIPKNVRKVIIGSFKGIYELATARVWVDNSRKPAYTRKRKKQFYIQTWHGGIPGKRVEKESVTPLLPAWIKASKNDSKMADVFISNSKVCTEQYNRAFWYNGEIWEVGYPRNDFFINGNDGIKNKVLSALNIPEDAKIVLYAPTFRNGTQNVYNLDYKRIKETLEKKFGGHWIVLVRFHPIMKNITDFLESKDIINCTSYPDMYELLLATDIEITDYSSSIFEFACLRRKPAFVYAEDVDAYARERGFVFDIRKLPFPLGESNEELMHKIIEFNEDEYFKELDSFNSEIEWYEHGDASKLIAAKIKEQCV